MQNEIIIYGIEALFGIILIIIILSFGHFRFIILLICSSLESIYFKSSSENSPGTFIIFFVSTVDEFIYGAIIEILSFLIHKLNISKQCLIFVILQLHVLLFLTHLVSLLFEKYLDKDGCNCG